MKNWIIIFSLLTLSLFVYAQKTNDFYINYYPKSPVKSNNKIEFEVYYYDPNDINKTQILVKLLEKFPFKNNGFSIYLTAEYPGSEGTLLYGWANNFYSNDSMIIQPFKFDTITNSLYFFKYLIYDKGQIDFYINLDGTLSNNKLIYAGPITFRKETFLNKYRSHNKPMANNLDSIFNKHFKLKKIPYPIYFTEYDSSLDLKFKTPPKTIYTSSGKSEDVLSNLIPNTKYYQRQVVIAISEIIYGNIITFKTKDSSSTSVELDKNIILSDFSKIHKKSSHNKILYPFLSLFIICFFAFLILKMPLQTVAFKAIFQSIFFSLFLIIGSIICILIFKYKDYFFIHPYIQFIMLISGIFLLLSNLIVLYEKKSDK